MKEYTFTSLTPNLKKTNLMLLALGISYIGYKIYNKILKKKISYIEKINESKKYIFNQIYNQNKILFIPKVGMILGSGQNDIIKNFKILREIPYKNIPYFPISTVEGHYGKLILASMKNIDIVIMQGRFHSYEGYDTKEVSYPVRVMKSLGIKTLIITNSSGAVNKNLNTGDIIVVKDHVYLPGLVGFSPLSGPNNNFLGKRFIALNNIYKKKYRRYILSLAEQSPNLKSIVKEGVYCGVAGPCYETPAEVKFISSLNCDIVGMSTIPEVIVAAHSEISVLVLGLVTNKCIDVDESIEKPNHKEVCINAQKGTKNLQYLIDNFIHFLQTTEQEHYHFQKLSFSNNTL
jgi:purine-nucleoside phosphorylase